jgi:hypothetical protein
MSNPHRASLTRRPVLFMEHFLGNLFFGVRIPHHHEREGTAVYYRQKNRRDELETALKHGIIQREEVRIVARMYQEPVVPAAPPGGGGGKTAVT